MMYLVGLYEVYFVIENRRDNSLPKVRGKGLQKQSSKWGKGGGGWVWGGELKREEELIRELLCYMYTISGNESV